MAELLSGKDVILFFRKRADHATEDGAKLKFQSEHSVSKSKNNEATVTKDGTVNSISDGENTLDLTSFAYTEDTATVPMWKELEAWYDDNELTEIWEVNIASLKTERYDVTYYQGYFTSFEMSYPGEGNVELSMSYAINGKGVKGTDTLTAEQLASIESAAYEYQTIAKTGV